MSETLYGSLSPLWPAIPVPGFGYVQPPPGKGFFNSTGLAASQPATGPAFPGSEVAVGVTAPALLAAVAVRRGQPLGPTNDQEIEDFICDALDLIAGTSDVEVRCEGGRAILTGTVPHKRLKRDVGEIAWAIPSIADVQNSVTIAARRRTRNPARDTEAPASGVPSRKQA